MYKELLVLQDKINSQICGSNWKSHHTYEDYEVICGKTHRKTAFKKALFIESVEAMDSLNWKHWKDVDNDDNIDNLKIELVDIYHFILSLVLISKVDNDKMIELVTIPDTVMEYNQSLMSILDTLVYRAHSFYRSRNDIDDIKSIVDMFNILINKLNWSNDEFLKLFIGKATLNYFRNINGYASGEYIKTWGTVEDNVVMQDIIESLSKDKLTLDNILGELDKRYVKVKLNLFTYN